MDDCADRGRLIGYLSTSLQFWTTITWTVSGLGLAPVFMYVGNLANWAGDDTALERCRAATALGPLVVLFGAISMLNGWAGFFVLGPPILWGGGLYFLFIVLPMVHLVRTFSAVSQLGAWSLANHRHERARLERLQESAAANLATAESQRARGVVQDTSQPDSALMPGPASGAGRPVAGGGAGQSIRPGNRRSPPKLRP